jgi:RNA polymerase sigma-70 factor (ECF subfamily)
MQPGDASQRLSRISTIWTLVRQAHGGSSGAGSAQEALMERYSGAVHRYLLACLQDPHAADEVFQDFALRFLRGDFKNAHPERGRFRSYVKSALFHLITDYRRQQKRALPQTPDLVEPAAKAPEVLESDRAFLSSWRDELMERTWQALREWERTTGHPYHTILRFRVDQPLLSSEQMAERLGPVLGRSLSVAAARQALHRAREKFADLLLEEVAQSLEGPTREQLEAELIDLEILSYCRSALERRERE